MSIRRHVTIMVGLYAIAIPLCYFVMGPIFGQVQAGIMVGLLVFLGKLYIDQRWPVDQPARRRR